MREREGERERGRERGGREREIERTLNFELVIVVAFGQGHLIEMTPFPESLTLLAKA